MVKKVLGMLLALGLLVSPVFATQKVETTNATPEKKEATVKKKVTKKKTVKKAPKKEVNATEEKKAQ